MGGARWQNDQNQFRDCVEIAANTNDDDEELQTVESMNNLFPFLSSLLHFSLFPLIDENVLEVEN